MALTADAVACEREECAAAGMTEHLAKLFTVTELERVLARRARPIVSDAA